MGSDAEIHLFDTARFHQAAVPDLVGLLDGVLPSPTITALLSLRFASERDADIEIPVLADDLDAFRCAGFSRHCSYLTLRDLAWKGSLQPGQDWCALPEERQCKLSNCPAHDGCPIYGTQRNERMESLNNLFQHYCWYLCEGDGAFVGRTMIAIDYLEMFIELGISLPPRSVAHLRALASRGWVLGYDYGILEGVQGWLDQEETAELLADLAPLSLPEVGAFDPISMWDSHPRGFPASGHFEGQTIGRFRTYLARAVARARGVLWANDLRGPVWDLAVFEPHSTRSHHARMADDFIRARISELIKEIKPA